MQQSCSSRQGELPAKTGLLYSHILFNRCDCISYPVNRRRPSCYSNEERNRCGECWSYYCTPSENGLIAGSWYRFSSRWKYCIHIYGTDAMASDSSKVSRQWNTHSFSKDNEIQTLCYCHHCRRFDDYFSINLPSD